MQCDFLVGLFFDGDLDGNLTTLREFNRVANQIRQRLDEAPCITDDFIGDTRAEPVDKLQTLLLCPDGQRPHGQVELLTDFEKAGRKIKAAGLNAREVEHIADDRQQVAGRRADHAKILVLHRVECRVEEQLRNAQDSVERSPQLVTHVGEKLALQPAALFGIVKRLGESRVEFLKCAFCGERSLCLDAVLTGSCLTR